MAGLKCGSFDPNVAPYPGHMIFEQVANLLWRSWTLDGSIREGEDRVAFLEILDGMECPLHGFRRIIGTNSWVGPCFRHTFNLNKRKYLKSEEEKELDEKQLTASKLSLIPIAVTR